MNREISNSNHFYAELPRQQIPVSQLVAERSLFVPVPKDWHVVVTDIKGSTKAVKSGLQQEVNLVATGSIIAALNIGRSHGISLPFFFGGDGATLLVPNTILDLTMMALQEHSRNTLKNYRLDLRVGQVPVAEVYRHGDEILLAKGSLGQRFTIPVVLGNGLKTAERLIKDDPNTLTQADQEDSLLNLEGMECRWDLIKPPDDKKEIVCLLVEVIDQEKHAEVFQKVLKKVDDIYGPQEQRNPITIPKLKLKATPGRIAREMLVKYGRFRWFYLLKHFFLTYFGFVYFWFYDSGKQYLHSLVELSDVLVLDGRINTVITGTANQREELTRELNRIEAAGEIIFGLHVSQESVMSCYVRNREDQHIHFVDGSKGGYTQAAGILKKKLRQLQNS